jgi:hypothetical protein
VPPVNSQTPCRSHVNNRMYIHGTDTLTQSARSISSILPLIRMTHTYTRASPVHNVPSHLGRAEGLFQDMKAVVNKDMVKKVSAHPWHGVLSRSYLSSHTRTTLSCVHAKCNWCVGCVAGMDAGVDNASSLSVRFCRMPTAGFTQCCAFRESPREVLLWRLHF